MDPQRKGLLLLFLKINGFCESLQAELSEKISTSMEETCCGRVAVRPSLDCPTPASIYSSLGSLKVKRSDDIIKSKLSDKIKKANCEPLPKFFVSYSPYLCVAS